MTGNIDRGSIDLPAEGDRIRTVVHRAVGLFRRRSGGIVNDVNLVAIVSVVHRIVADLGNVAEAESLSGLLANVYTGLRSNRTVARCKLIRVGIRFNGAAKGFGGTQRGVLDVVGIQISKFCAGRRFRDGGQTIPSNARPLLSGSVLGVENALLNAGFVPPSAGGIPSKLRHIVSLHLVEN